MTGRLQGKRIIITGAGGAIGRSSAVRFVSEGASVGLVDVRPEELDQTAQLVRQEGGLGAQFTCDVRNENQVEQAVRTLSSELGGIDTLFANAGIMPHADVSVLTADFNLWREIIETNLFGISMFAKYCAPRIAEAGGGAIVTMGSFLAVMGCSYPQDGYSASKGAIEALTRSLAVQLGPRRIRVNGLAPGPILTPHVERFFADEEARSLRLRRIPLGRFGTLADAAALAAFLASDDASWMTGQMILLDGGISTNYL